MHNEWVPYDAVLLVHSIHTYGMDMLELGPENRNKHSK